MESEVRTRTRKSLHQINNDLSIASMTLELMNIKLQKEFESEFRSDLLQSCTSALDAVRRAGRIANETLHEIR